MLKQKTCASSTIVFLILLALAVKGYQVSYEDTYTYEGSSTDAKSWVNDYTLSYYMSGCSVATPAIIIWRRDSGQELGRVCQTTSEGNCVGVGGITSTSCNSDAVGSSNMCNTPYSMGLEQDMNYTDSLYADYWIDDGSTCTQSRTSGNIPYYIINAKFYTCSANQSSLLVLGNSGLWNTLSNPVNTLFDTHTCPSNTYCDKTFEYFSETSATYNFTENRCVSCSANSTNFTNYCVNPKTWKTYQKNSYVSCGSGTYIEEGTTVYCDNNFFCDYSENDSAHNASLLSDPCFVAADSTNIVVSDDWATNGTVESTTNDAILFNDSTLSLQLDEGITYSYPAEVTCYTNASPESVYARIIINGEVIYVYYGSWIDSVVPGLYFMLMDYNLAEQTATIAIDDSVSVQDGFLVSIRNQDYAGQPSATMTFTMNGNDYETTLTLLDFVPCSYVACYADNAVTMGACVNASANKSAAFSSRSLKYIYDNYPGKLLTGTDAFGVYSVNLSGEQQKKYNVSMKYFTHCNENTSVNYEALNSTAARLTEIWNADQPYYIVAAYRKTECINDSAAQVYAYDAQNNKYGIGNVYSCASGYGCVANNSETSYSSTGLLNVSAMCSYLPTCFDSVKNNDETMVDYGGICGTCFDKVLNGNETKTSFHPYDYGGYYCGNCTAKNEKDVVWETALQMNNRKVPFDKTGCVEAQNGIWVLIIVFVITMGFVAVLLVGIIIVDTVGIWAIIMFFVRKAAKLKKKKDLEKQQKIYSTKPKNY